MGTVAANVERHGTGALNIDGCRVGVRTENESGWSKTGSKAGENRSMSGPNYARDAKDEAGLGRWPANIAHDGSEEVLAVFPETHGAGHARESNRHGEATGLFALQGAGGNRFGDEGSTARFFYCAKASKSDRNEGLEGLEAKPSYMVENGGKTAGLNGVRYERTTAHQNNHPTVKPTKLMRGLCRLITPPGGKILDPFMGSGSTGKAALLEGFEFVGIELQPEYCAIAEKRMSEIQPELKIA
jgi:site-specific DNA-methyltransferase (adenine-specific)